MVNTKKVKKNYKRGARIASWGLAGGITGTTAGFYGTGGRLGEPGTPKQIKAAYKGWKVGAIAGTAYGVHREHRKFGHSVPSTSASTGPKQFKNRVGTKTQGRVGGGGLPFNPSTTMQHGDADIGAV